MLLSIKTGGCPGGLRLLPAVGPLQTDVARTDLVSLDEVTRRPRASARDQGATRFCMGAAWRDVPHGAAVRSGARRWCAIVRGARLEACCTLGMLDAGPGRRAGRRRSDRLQPQPRHLARVLRQDHHHPHLRRAAGDAGARPPAGVTVCCGGIIGMGEEPHGARYGLLQQLATLDPHPESVPINLLVGVEGTPLAEPAAGGSARAGADDRHRPDPDADVVRAPERRPPVAQRRGPGALLPRRRQLGLPRRAAADHPEPGAERTMSSCSTRLGMRLTGAAAAVDRSGCGDNPLEARVRGAPRRRCAATGCCGSLRPPAGIDLSSNDYLNLAAHPPIVSRLRRRRRARGLRQHRLATAARSIATPSPQVERRFASFKGTERSLYLLHRLPGQPGGADHVRRGRRRQVFSDALNHASLIDGDAARRAAAPWFSPHNDVAGARRGCSTTRRAPAIRFVVVESLFSMDGDEAPLARLRRALPRPGAS